ncbi:MarC family protein [Brachybacterium sp. JHP9]|uniref:UPF0056 membrane protein n=1 Tax=Brachybacterium equifaecis TaxID=2910770 RepID=A0ABT0R340_9MICO|nr:MarC family protein [Brachybacterium equifaecis]MCL6424332.1 MarC family protein [Brachybacterium equifaecis]
MTLWSAALAAFAALIPIANPIGGLAAFTALSGGMSPQQAKSQAVKTAINVFAILALSAVLGTFVLHFLGLSIPVLQIAGGLVVGHSGFQMLTATPKLSADEQGHAAAKTDISFTPMALPLIAGPGAMAAMIALQSRAPHLLPTIGVVAGIAVFSALLGVLLRWGPPLVEKMGPSGIGALTRVMGFFILAIGVELIVTGAKAAGF